MPNGAKISLKKSNNQRILITWGFFLRKIWFSHHQTHSFLIITKKTNVRNLIDITLWKNNCLCWDDNILILNANTFMQIMEIQKTRKIFLFQQDVKQVQVHFPGYLFNSWILMLENMSLVWVSQCHSRCTPTSTKSYFLVFVDGVL